jgi:nitrite reductase/ring-hydroxylating ferredoxin subunit
MSASPEQLLALVRRSLDTGTGLAAECYREPAFFALERERVLRPGWHAVARWDALPEAGEHMPVDLLGEPILVVRGEDGTLRAFSNVCPHRGHIVAGDRGRAKTLVCPYHRWAFGLDGALRAAPLMDETPGFDRARCGLTKLRTALWQGFLLVCLDDATPDVLPSLAPLDERLADAGLAELVEIGTLEFDSAWNWKVMVDNFMESYHHLGIHVDSLQKTHPAKGTYGVEGDGPFAILENPGVEEGDHLLVAQVFPTLLFSIVEGIRFGVWYEMQIEGPDRFRLVIHALAPPELARAEGAPAALMGQVEKIHHEDIAACEGVQRGLASRIWRPGPLSVKELCLARFHRHLAQRLGA